MKEKGAFWMWKGCDHSMCLEFMATMWDKGELVFPLILLSCGCWNGMCLGGMRR